MQDLQSQKVRISKFHLDVLVYTIDAHITAALCQTELVYVQSV